MLLTRNDAFRVVFNLRTPISQNAEEFGTGLFVNKTDKELFLVTASHVAKTCNINTQVVISDQNGNSKSFRLLDFNPRLAWVHHPIADICALRIVPNDLIAPELSSRFFPYSQLNMTFPLFFTFNQLRFHATSFSLPLANQSFKYCMGDW